MPKFQIRRTWPCGMQESVTAEGWTVMGAPSEDDKPRLCPQHGVDCQGGRR